MLLWERPVFPGHLDLKVREQSLFQVEQVPQPVLGDVKPPVLADGQSQRIRVQQEQTLQAMLYPHRLLQASCGRKLKPRQVKASKKPLARFVLACRQGMEWRLAATERHAYYHWRLMALKLKIL